MCEILTKAASSLAAFLLVPGDGWRQIDIPSRFRYVRCHQHRRTHPLPGPLIQQGSYRRRVETNAMQGQEITPKEIPGKQVAET